MRGIVVDKLERGRIRDGGWGSDPSDGLNGAFEVFGPCGAMLRIIASDATEEISEGWEHVSVSLANRCPNWQEMSFVKELFWLDEETVIQFHPPKSEHINIHPYCLHLWRHTGIVFPLPPSILVGPKGMSK